MESKSRVQKIREWWFVALILLTAEISALVGVGTFIWAFDVYQEERDARQQQAYYAAWQTITSAHGQSGNGGRTEALEYLNNENQSLEAINLEGAILVRVELQGADLRLANLSPIGSGDSEGTSEGVLGGRVSLFGADLRKARLDGAQLREASLRCANLAGAEGLTQSQINKADGNVWTGDTLPEEFKTPTHWISNDEWNKKERKECSQEWPELGTNPTE